ncbi:CPBP family intramembrane glutamic endopeptidase [Kordiimonas sp. SCSIO 12610]|uniref:CPBP family intramembrane glutamic endopeptidase n=1 Tax=Kordiimonas sp. SCSIO 12610 TaxID=2829597 RepID=UPI002109C1AE|nr:CPBP family intramembrane glutamic endopeptidase [Kordiimonas sp. SCSIO 12610]UTW56224.1 CPBP family intramembrane metalloprotease [Kordiimonas sp. SCSIO 12610]
MAASLLEGETANGTVQPNMDMTSGVISEVTSDVSSKMEIVGAPPLGSSPTSIDLTLMLIIGVGLPFVGWVLHKREMARKEKGVKTPLLASYQHSLLFLWVPTILLIAAWIYQGRTFDQLGLGFAGTWQNWLGLGIVVILSAFYMGQAFRVKTNERAAESVRKGLEGEAGIQDIAPQSHKEYRVFQILSLSAGLTEEIMFRAFLVWGLSHYMPVILAAALSLAAFTLAHLYQQTFNAIIRVLLMGGTLTLVYLLSGSLWPAIILHAGVDLGSGAILWYARQNTGPDQSE